MNEPIKVEIEYCVQGNYEPRALRARSLLEETFNAEVTIAGGRSGSFEITTGGDLLFSKLADHRFPEDDEIRRMLDGR